MSMTKCKRCGGSKTYYAAGRDGEAILTCSECGDKIVPSIPLHRHGKMFGTSESVSESEDQTKVFLLGLLAGWFCGLVTFVIGAIIWGN